MKRTFGTPKPSKKKSGGGIRVFLVIALGGLLRLRSARGPRDLSFEETKVEITKGSSLSAFYEHLSSAEVFWLKWYLRQHPESFTSLQEGTYALSGTYTAIEFLEHIAKGPEKNYISYTVLEWWSIYDIDADLTSKGLITEGDYISYTTNLSKIEELSQKFDFLPSTAVSMEGFLYPDTYYLDNRQDLVRQLVSIQLNTFKKKVRDVHSSDFSTIQSNYGLEVYKAIILASIVEKEEKNSANKPTVAGIFYNRIKIWMGIEADITLCYNFKKPYSSCTPSVIAKNISDTTNPYNTRRVVGLPPTPISNPDLDTIKAVLFPQSSNYLFYLHGTDGKIYYATTNTEHNANKKYL